MSSNSEKYKNLINRFFLYFFFRKLRRILSQLDLDGEISILEVGCGEGFVLSILKEVFPQAKLLGVDISRQALDKAKQRVPQAVLELADASKLNYDDNSFDLVVCLEVLEHLPDPTVVAQEMLRVSKKYIIISVPWEPWFSLGNLLRGRWLKRWGRHPEHLNYWTKKDFLKWLAAAVGLDKIKGKFYSFPWLLFLLVKNEDK